MRLVWVYGGGLELGCCWLCNVIGLCFLGFMIHLGFIVCD